jgi:transcriptional regulator with XRE-family HTH domain
MATGTIYAATHVSGLIQNGYASGVAQPDTPDIDPRLAFARVVREAREQRDWTQDELAEKAGVTRPTIQRWETAKTGTPDPVNARRVFLALGLDPRLIPVILGYVTEQEMGLPPTPARVFAPTVEQAIRLLEDPGIPSAAKRELVEFLQFRADQSAKQAPKQAS